MLPTVHIGPLTLPTGGLILLLAVWIGLARAEKTAPRAGVAPDQFYNLALVMIIAGLIGARLGYAARHLSAFLASPGSVLSLSAQMLSSFDGILVAALAGIVYAQRVKIPLAGAADALAPALAILMVGIHISALASGSAFGTPTRLPWGIPLWGALRHPTQLYETVAALLILLAIWPRASAGWAPGVRFLILAALTALARLVLEYFRADCITLAGGLRAAQLAAFAILAVCLALIPRLQKKS